MEVIPVTEISIDCKRVEFWKTLAFMLFTALLRVTLVGIAPVYPDNTPFLIIGKEGALILGVTDEGEPCVLAPAPFTALTDIV
jgi:hypothetical protein